MIELTLKDIMTNEYYKCKTENSSTKIGGFILHQKKNGEYRSCELVKIKEVKKMKKSVDYNKLPYFEVKVVNWYPDKETIKCSNCGKILDLQWSEKRPKGNWVNGENLDKIKEALEKGQPCLCSYKTICMGYKKHGMLITDIDNEGNNVLHLIKMDSWGIKILLCAKTTYYCDENLKKLFEEYDIHILKGKIILFEEE